MRMDVVAGPECHEDSDDLARRRGRGQEQGQVVMSGIIKKNVLLFFNQYKMDDPGDAKQTEIPEICGTQTRTWLVSGQVSTAFVKQNAGTLAIYFTHGEDCRDAENSDATTG